MRVVMAFLSVILVAALATAQQSPPTDAAASDAETMLRQVTQKYADAKSLHLEAIQESTFSKNDLSGGWDKMILSAMLGPDNRYRYEGRGASGSGLLVSDGKTIWTYHYNENLFTGKAVGPEKP